MPISPFFANLFLEGFDNAVISRQLNAVRYADDLIFFASSEAECLEIDAFCREQLAPLGLSIPLLGPGKSSKTQIAGPVDGVEFLGLCLQPRQGGGYELALGPLQRASIKNEIMALSDIPSLVSKGIGLSGLARLLDAKVGGYLSSYECCSDLSELENDLADAHQKVLRKLYREGLGIDLGSLKPHTRAFLGLS